MRDQPSRTLNPRPIKIAALVCVIGLLLAYCAMDSIPPSNQRNILLAEGSRNGWVVVEFAGTDVSEDFLVDFRDTSFVSANYTPPVNEAYSLHLYLAGSSGIHRVSPHDLDFNFSRLVNEKYWALHFGEWTDESEGELEDLISASDPTATHQEL